MGVHPEKRLKITFFRFRIVVAILDGFHFDLRKSTEVTMLAPLAGKFCFIYNAGNYTFWLIWFINQRALYNHALSIIIIGVVLHQHHHCHLCTPPPGPWLDIETSYLVHICTYVPHICTSNI